MDKAVWADPPENVSLDECYFYHTMDIPGQGVVKGEWDLRGREARYLGDLALHGKRVLEIGPASGCLSFYMEGMGAKVTAYDLSERQKWDVVPYTGVDQEACIAERKQRIRQLNNGFWFAHKAFGSKARVMYGSVYDVPESIGSYDICTFGSVLLHLRDPFLALQRATVHARETVIVTDLLPPLPLRMASIAGRLVGMESIHFRPRARKQHPKDAWWFLSPGLVAEFLHILGFPHTQITYHCQRFGGRNLKLFTVMGRRDES